MGDLAVAMVDLARSAEERRVARRHLRQSVEVVAYEILRHMRTGDYAAFPDPTGLSEGNIRHFYVAEAVSWPQKPRGSGEGGPADRFGDPAGVGLVRYVGSPTLPGNSAKPIVHGGVMNDPREPWQTNDGVDWVPLGRDLIWCEPQVERVRYEAKLHLANDEELGLFADEALVLTKMLGKQLHRHAGQFRTAADKLTKLSPR